jgi:hypothetical protein
MDLPPRRGTPAGPGPGTRTVKQLARQNPTYWLAPGQVVVLLTTFRKTRSAETAEVARALHAQKICEAEHGPAHDTFDREVT